MVVARLISAIMRSSHSVPGVKYASMCAGALAGGVTVRVGNCAPTPTPMANAIAITKVHCLTNIQPQTKDHSNKEWSGVDRFKNRTPLPLGQALLYSNSIPTIVGTLEVVVLGRSNPFSLLMPRVLLLAHTYSTPFPTKIKDGVGRDEITARICDIPVEKLLNYLKNPHGTKYKLLDIIAKKTGATIRPRENKSFASKFCHYACFYLFEGMDEQDNYSIYDSILKNALPLYIDYNSKL